LTRQSSPRLPCIALAIALLVTACGDGEDDGTADRAGDGPLGGTCPSPLVIQTDWWPESEHGALYELLGDGYTIDASAKSVTGSLTVDGGTSDTGIDLEIRSGGPAVGFTPPRRVMYTDDAIHLAYSSNDAAALGSDDNPTLAVVAPLEKNPQMVMWDPAKYPDVESLADLGDRGITINVLLTITFPDVLVAQGIWSEDQLDRSYDGSPARFIAADGEIAQQGFASSEPYNYENVFENWGRPLEYQLIHDAGFQVYSQPLAIRSDDLETLRPCLQLLVPIIQQAVVDFTLSPQRANAIIVDTVNTFDSGWVYDDGIAEFSTATMEELGIAGNGPDSTVGNFDLDRVQAVIDAMAAAGMEIPDGLTADQLVTNEFIDGSIGF
jgi:hypothetical protein